MKKLFLLIMLPALFGACSSTKSPRSKPVDVTMAINIRSDNSVNFVNLSTDMFLFKVKDVINDFQYANIVYVDPEDKPQIVLDIMIESLDIGQTQTSTSRRSFSTRIQTGTDAASKPVYQTITATADIEQERIPARAYLSYKLTFKDSSPAKTTQQKFYENYTWQKITVGNVQGDSRAIDPSLYTMQSAEIEPLADDLLLTMSKRELLRRISDDIRRYYPKPKS